MANVFRRSEISLFGTFYPLVGSVQPVLASVWPAKQVVGDYSKDTEQIASSWIIQDQRGGIGIKDMVEATDAARCWWSTCELGYKGHILLPTLVTDAGNDTLADAVVLIEYGNEMYAAFGTSVRKRVEGTTSWGAELQALGTTPTDAIVYRGKLYFACGTDFERFDGTTWTTGTALSSGGATPQPSRYFVEWDSKLFILDNTGQLDYSTDEGVTWITSALSTLPTGYFNSLFLYHNIAGEVVVHLGTKQGLYALDFDNSDWHDPVLPLPYHDYACVGAVWWRDACYLSSGMAVYQYVTSNPAVVTPMGPDRDYGLPSDYRGNIVKLLAGHNGLYAFIDATAELSRDQYLAGDDEYGNLVFYDNVGYSAILKWDGYGWSVVYLSSAADLPLKGATIATADDIYRLWFGLDMSVFYVPLQVTIANPLEVTDFPFAASGEHISPWFDKDNAVIDGLAFLLTAYAKETSATEYIKIYYGLDYDDDTWTLLTNTDFADGQIDSDGEAAFAFASGAGVAFKAIRFKAELVRGSTTTVSPDLRWLRLSYIKLLEPKWGFSVRIDCTKNYRFKSAKGLVTALKTALATQTLGTFQFKNGNGSESHQVRIASLSAAEIGGKKSLGIYKVNLVAP